MLVLTRKPKEEIRIGNGVTITILRVKGQSVRIGIDAPKNVQIVRGELKPETEESVETEAGAVLSNAIDSPSNEIPSDSRSDALSQSETFANSANSDNKRRNRCEQSLGQTRGTARNSPAACSTRMSGARRSSTLKALVARNRAAATSNVSPTTTNATSHRPPR